MQKVLIALGTVLGLLTSILKVVVLVVVLFAVLRIANDFDTVARFTNSFHDLYHAGWLNVQVHN
jgi:hypothetical protein